VSNAVVILPYLFIQELEPLVDRLNNTFIDYIIEEDTGRIGPDMMYQKLWNKTDKDIIILHSDMMPLEDDVDNKWYDDLCSYAKVLPEAGIVGCKLLYPAKHKDKFVIQYAGGKFKNDGTPDHFGSGLDIGNNRISKELELDEGQYDYVREVAWATFGGIYIKREVLNKIGNFDPQYEWSYNRDVDYSLEVRKAGYKIYQTPTTLFHYESKDVKRIRTQEMIDKEQRNLRKLHKKWLGSELYRTIDIKVKND
jgi:GT2 family glycosyltransferase